MLSWLMRAAQLIQTPPDPLLTQRPFEVAVRQWKTPLSLALVGASGTLPPLTRIDLCFRSLAAATVARCRGYFIPITDSTTASAAPKRKIARSLGHLLSAR